MFLHFKFVFIQKHCDAQIDSTEENIDVLDIAKAGCGGP